MTTFSIGCWVFLILIFAVLLWSGSSPKAKQS